MIAVVCVDDKMGMTFLGRRLSRDSMLRARLIELCGGACLRMNSYSKGQFEEEYSIFVSESFLEEAETGDFCFVENCDITPFEEKIEKVLLYKWNRHYPSDVKFTFPLEEKGFVLKNVYEFEGSSHEKITEEIWER
ncbi:MAG: ribonuclease Z [Ruminococcaceae bacterium]|nr:ribonuclease Z [Oscillospiraceae bacterium]